MIIVSKDWVMSNGPKLSLTVAIIIIALRMSYCPLKTCMDLLDVGSLGAKKNSIGIFSKGIFYLKTLGAASVCTYHRKKNSH